MEIENNYFVFIVTNREKNELEVGITGDLGVRLYQLEYELQRGSMETNTKSDCVYLIYWETIKNMEDALLREKMLKKLSKKKWMELINAKNPNWAFFNSDIYQGATLSL